ncbi:MAG: hypothetical protein QXG08_06245 [Candidatus Methanomethyliaceae archaeon]
MGAPSLLRSLAQTSTLARNSSAPSSSLSASMRSLKAEPWGREEAANSLRRLMFTTARAGAGTRAPLHTGRPKTLTPLADIPHPPDIHAGNL